jgi:hypothetical protein
MADEHERWRIINVVGVVRQDSNLQPDRYERQEIDWFC